MHSLVRRYIRTAIGFLIVGLAVGTWMLVRREILLRAPIQHQVSAYTHAIAVGFVMMMILGVALWLFPRPAEGSRYRPSHAEAAYWLLTIGTGGRVAAELARTVDASLWLRWVVVATGVAQAAGLLVYFETMWDRVRAAGSRVREERGERF